MASLTLAVLAAGIGSRYGGLKQMDPVGPAGEFILDYSVYDALRAGFDRVVFVIRRDLEAAFRATLGERIGRQVATEYVFQELDALPSGFAPPPGRVKPWGTGHALLVCAPAVTGPVAVINADDFYGAASYRLLADFLRRTADTPDLHALAGFILRRTLSGHGTVSRGVCRVEDGTRLAGIVERTGLREDGPAVVADDGTRLTGEEAVSMNMWAFKPGIFPALRAGFERFLRAHGGEPKSEFYLPALVDEELHAGRARVEVLRTPDLWFGVTHPQDKPAVVAAIRERIARGAYPARLWNA